VVLVRRCSGATRTLESRRVWIRGRWWRVLIRGWYFYRRDSLIMVLCNWVRFTCKDTHMLDMPTNTATISQHNYISERTSYFNDWSWQPIPTVGKFTNRNLITHIKLLLLGVTVVILLLQGLSACLSCTMPVKSGFIRSGMDLGSRPNSSSAGGTSVVKWGVQRYHFRNFEIRVSSVSVGSCRFIPSLNTWTALSARPLLAGW